MGAGQSSTIEHLKHKPRRRSLITSGWRSRQLPTQIFGVVRHAERADCVCALYGGGRWTQTEDFKNWPIDPPLSDSGVEAAKDLGHLIKSFAAESTATIHVVITSPYTRCVRTAAEICGKLGSGARMIVDLSLGEVFGPDIMGDQEPACPVRPQTSVHEICMACGVKCLSKTIGKWPTWPEDLRTARRRFGDRFLTYLQRSQTARRNFVIVTHADAVGAAASLMPSTADQFIGKVDYGGCFLAQRTHATNEKEQPARRASSSSATAKGSSASFSRRSTCPSFVSVCPSPAREASPSPRGFKKTFSTEDEAPAGCVHDNENAIILDELAACGLLPRPRRDVWMLDRAPTSPLSAAGMIGGEDTPTFLEPPPVCDGWTVRTHNMTLHRKPGKKKGLSGALSKKLQTFTRNSKFTQAQIEQLLGEMPNRPLGGDSFNEIDRDASFSPHFSPSTYGHVNLNPTICSLSTYLFGASEVASSIDQLSDVGSDFSGEDSCQTQDLTVGSLNGSSFSMERPMARLHSLQEKSVSNSVLADEKRRVKRSSTAVTSARRASDPSRNRHRKRNTHCENDLNEASPDSPRLENHRSKTMGAGALEKMRVSRDAKWMQPVSVPPCHSASAIHMKLEELTKSETLVMDSPPFKDCGGSSLMMRRRASQGNSCSPGTPRGEAKDSQNSPKQAAQMGFSDEQPSKETTVVVKQSPKDVPTLTKIGELGNSMLMRRRASASLKSPTSSTCTSPRLQTSSGCLSEGVVTPSPTPRAEANLPRLQGVVSPSPMPRAEVQETHKKTSNLLAEAGTDIQRARHLNGTMESTVSSAKDAVVPLELMGATVVKPTPFKDCGSSVLMQRRAKLKQPLSSLPATCGGGGQNASLAEVSTAPTSPGLQPKEPVSPLWALLNYDTKVSTAPTSPYLQPKEPVSPLRALLNYDTKVSAAPTSPYLQPKEPVSPLRALLNYDTKASRPTSPSFEPPSPLLVS